MKNYLVAALALLSVSLFTGCSKDDDNVSTPEPTVTGKWKTVKFEYYENNVLTGATNVVEDNSSCPDYLEFKANAVFESIEKDGDCVASLEQSGTYTKNGSSLVLNYGPSESQTLNLVELTDTDLVFDFTYTDSNGTTKVKGFLKKI